MGTISHKNALAVALTPEQIAAIEKRAGEMSGLLRGSAMADRIQHWSPAAEAETRAEILVFMHSLAMNTIEIGARFWMLREKAAYGTWTAYIEEHFPGLNIRTVRHWMLAFRRTAGKALPAETVKALSLDDAEPALDDPDIDKRLADPDAVIKTYAELAAEADRQAKKIEKGREQLASRDGRIEALEREVKRLRDEGDLAHIPPGIQDDEKRAQLIEAWLWRPLVRMQQNPPRTKAGLGIYASMLERMKGQFDEYWQDTLYPIYTAALGMTDAEADAGV